MRKMLIAALAGALLALAVGALAGAGASNSSDDTTVTETVTDTVEAPKPEDAGGGVREAGEDISGPCDEAENANDPRCAGTPAPAPAPAPRVDNSGPGSVDSGHHDEVEDGDDNSGSGHGGGDSGSGHGGGDDD